MNAEFLKKQSKSNPEWVRKIRENPTSLIDEILNGIEKLVRYLKAGGETSRAEFAGMFMAYYNRRNFSEAAEALSEKEITEYDKKFEQLTRQQETLK